MRRLLADLPFRRPLRSPLLPEGLAAVACAAALWLLPVPAVTQTDDIPLPPPAGSQPSPDGALPARDAAGDDPDDIEFFLDLDTGGHRAYVRDLDFSSDGRWLVSASDDRTVRIWDWQAGVTVRTLRGQIGELGEGKVNAVAISPDGTRVATGGVFGPVAEDGPYGDVRVFDAGSGRMAAVLKGLAAPVTALAFSADGRRLAAGSSAGYVQLWERVDADLWRQTLRIDTRAEGLRRLAFLGGGRLVTLSAIAGLGHWDVSSGAAVPLGKGAEGLAGTPLLGLAVSADGTRLATGARDGAVHVLDAADMSLIARLPDRPFLPAELAFDGGNRLIVSCSDRCEGRPRAEIWRPEAGAPAAIHTGVSGPTFAIAVAPDGRTVASAEGNGHAIELWDAETLAGRDRLAGGGAPVRGVGLTASGELVAWGAADPCPERQVCPEALAPLDRMLALPTAELSFTDPQPLGVPAAAFERAVLQSGGTTLSAGPVPGNRYDMPLLTVRRAGAADVELYRAAGEGYYHSAFTLLPGAEELVTGGGDGSLLGYGTDGRFTGEYLSGGGPGHDDDVLGIAAASERPLLVTGSADKTLKLWNRETRAPIVTLFTAGADWILWTPQGYFHSSPSGDRFVGWHVNEGPDAAARFVTARQLKRHLHSPEIVRRAILTGDANAAARDLRGKDSELAGLLVNRPLDFGFRVLNDGVPIDGRIEIELLVEEEEAVEPESFGIFVNDRLVASLEGRGADGARPVVSVPVEAGENRIRINGFNSHGYLTERGGFVMNPVAEEGERKGTLYVAVVGVQEYPLLPDACNGRSCDLRFPVADAAEFLNVIARRTAPMFAGMEARVMVNPDPFATLPPETRSGALTLAGGAVLEPESDTVEDTLIDFLELPGPEDTSIVFIAGHGINIEEDYYLIPTDGRRREDARWRKSSLVQWRDIQDALEDAKGRKILFVDTCHAGNAYNVKLEKESVDARISVISATAANNVALELPELGHGVFSYSLIRGLDGAARREGGPVGILDLAAYVSNEVMRLTRERQEPVYHFPQPVTNFPVAQP